MGNSIQKLRREKPQQETEDGNASFACEICIEPVAADKKFNNKNHCAHPFCLDCIAKYIEAKIEDHTASIPCPGLNCQKVLDPFTCSAIIPPSIFSKWCDLLCENWVLRFERCYCPNRNCMALVVNECGGTVKKSKCPNCKKLFCFQCKLAWHAGYGCAESTSLRDRNDVLFGQLVERRAWIKCPGCGHCIERKEGCSTITCRCKTRFCYKCGRKVVGSAVLLGCRCRGSHCQAIFMILVVIGVFIYALFILFFRNIFHCNGKLC